MQGERETPAPHTGSGSGSRNPVIAARHEETVATKLDVFSVQMPTLGHKTYGTLLRRGFADSPDIDFDARWTTAERRFPESALNRILWQRVPIRAISQRNLDIKRFRSDLGISLLSRRLVERALKRHKIDVLHFHTQNAAWLSHAHSARIPTIITTDQTNAQIALEYPPWTRWSHAPSIALERRAVHAASAIVVFSQWAADSFINDYGLPPQRVHIIPVGVELDGFKHLETRQAGSPDKKRLLFVGGDFHRKGGPLLVDVFREKFEHRDVELHLMTNDSSVTSCGSVIVHRNVAPFSAAWYELYSQADIFVLPTLREAFGIAYIEAMAAGLPVIGSRISAVPEIVTENAGFLVEPNDPHALADRIEQLLDDPQLRRRLGDNGRARARRLFDVKVHLERLRVLFKEVAAAGIRP